ncbi:AraC family transcriptional regulator [Rhodopseudomonas pseudopalustris]|uniref:Transcriptional regulator, AraC family n=2 Tax=Rhodopseudomonas TaxID=1073 RepID=Q137P5_RHOPS|nr:helix-turn-helix domain-containing protein [Rhodopseudomonas pseudopalustris]ABE39694.1 transcriptional regulator, AraC family [Rhodopseudomonas palustris BisB5]MBB1092628.1 helix-turn-helix domain-containing protein [Rhodopseudomonas palustris]SEP21103.1 transcriptional regulator, AraC family [Rhodopseudomonas pseudopalustris]
MNVELLDDEPELLQDFSILRSHDPIEARDVMRRHGVEVIAGTGEGFFMRTNLVELPHVGLYFTGNAAPTKVLIPERAIALVHVCLHGHARLTSGAHRIEFTKGTAFVCPPRRRVQLDLGQDFRQLVLRVPEQVLERTLTSLIGFSPQQQIAFDPPIANNTPRYLGFRDLLRLLANRLDPAFSAWPSKVLVQLEQACITSLLCCSRHNLGHLLDATTRQSAPSYVLQAEHYAESRCEADLTAENLARAAGVSVSTLTRAFIKHRGCSPAALIKRVRLSRAKDLLESGSATTLVGVALRCGFANPSRFAKDYREAFGEPPTETLRRQRPKA